MHVRHLALQIVHSATIGDSSKYPVSQVHEGGFLVLVVAVPAQSVQLSEVPTHPSH
jgi:hypothetical protein